MSDAFKDEIVALIPKLRAYAISLTGSSAEADDLVQEALMRAWSFRASFQAGTNGKAWLYRILRNTFYTAAAKRRDTVQDIDGRLAAQLSCAPDQEWRMAYDELLQALDQLGAETRDAVVLVVAAGLSYREAADVCGVALGTMKSRVNRGREQLLRLIGPAEPPPPTRSAPRAPAMFA